MLVILSILATVVVVNFSGRPEQAKETVAKTDIASIGDQALEAYKIDNGNYPTSDEGLAALIEAPSSARIGTART